MDITPLLQLFGAEAVSRGLMLVPIIIGVVSAIKTALPAGRPTDIANAFAPILALVLGVVLNVLMTFALAGKEPVNVALAVLVGFLAGASASVTFKVLHSLPEMKASLKPPAE